MTSPDLALLTGPDVGDLLAAALATTGEELVDWRVRQVDHRPGAATTALFEATVRRGDATERQTFGASVGLARADDHPGVLQLSDGDRNVAVWRFPHDPGLPGLASAGDPEQMRLLLESLGGPALPPEEIRVRVRAYRPRRRAVVQVTAPGAGFFVKVLRPDRVEDVHRRHVLLHGAGVPVPRSLGWTDSGLLVLEPLPGTPMRSALWSATAPLPGADELVGVLDRLPEEVLDLPRRAAWSEHAEHYAALVGAALPEEAPRAASLGERIASAIEGAPATEPTHGDFYEAQLLLSHGRITGLLDVDTVGPGRRADDLACALAHVEVLRHR